MVIVSGHLAVEHEHPGRSSRRPVQKIQAEAHGDQHDDGHDHGSVRSYLTGFILSVILTAIPFAIVMAGGFESRFLTAAVVVGMAIVQILVADVSMSLDNVLAVAGAAHGHTTVLIVGLVLSIALMGLASTWIARVINRYPWIAWAGLLVILYVALKMIWEGWHEVQPEILAYVTAAL